jgi:hypothetical protein
MNSYIDYVLLAYLLTERTRSSNLQPGSWITSI